MRFLAKKIIGYFLRGFIFITPIVATFFVFIYVFESINELVEATQLKGILLVIFICSSFVVVTLFGYLGSLYLVKPIGHAVESIIKKVPLVNFIYTSLKDVLNALVLEKKKFDKPVFVKMLPDGSILKPGFITQDDFENQELKGKLAVYFPHSYAISGQVLLIDKKHIEHSDIPSSEMMKFIVSGGVTKIY